MTRQKLIDEYTKQISDSFSLTTFESELAKQYLINLLLENERIVKD